MRVFTIAEYGNISNQDDYQDYKSDLNTCYIDSKSFNQLVDFINDNALKGNEIDKAFKIFRSKGNLNIKVKNYVGLLETNTGIVIEIIPKISLMSDDPNIHKEESKKIFLKMLRHLKNSPFISINKAQLKVTKYFKILEVFINSYVQEVDKLLQSGILGDYIRHDENIAFLKGRINIGQQIKQNTFNKSRFRCIYKKFDTNNIYNQTVKNTLVKLFNTSSSHANRAKILKQLNQFINVECTDDSIKTLEAAQKKNNRLTDKYKVLLKWSEVFLKGKSFTNFAGNSINNCILFPMERIFEDFVSAQFRKYAEGYKIITQGKKGYYLVKQGDRKKFRLKPDIIAEIDNNMNYAIIDTKWKLLDQTRKRSNFDISISDMYQLYAYGNKFKNKDGSMPSLVLLYPKTDKFHTELEPYFYDENQNLKLRVIPYNLSLDIKDREEVNNILINS